MREKNIWTDALNPVLRKAKEPRIFESLSHWGVHDVALIIRPTPQEAAPSEKLQVSDAIYPRAQHPQSDMETLTCSQ
jgi:hypothetical protein